MLYTAQDAMEYMLATTTGGTQDSEHRALRAAVGNGYRDVIQHKDWTFHDGSIDIEANAFLPRPDLSPTAPENYDGPYSVRLPEDCKNVDSLVAPDRTTPCCYCTLQEYERLRAYDTSPGSTIFWTVVMDEDMPSRRRLLIAGKGFALYEGDMYTLTYRRKPEPLRYFGYEKVCRSSTWSEVPDGRVVRYGTDTSYPEGPYGIHPFTEEVIKGTQLVPPENTGKMLFTDRMDVADYMWSACLSASEVWYARLTGKNVEGALTIYSRDMRLAMEQDGLAPFAGRRTYVLRYPEMMEMPYASTGTARSLGYYSPEEGDTGTPLNPTAGTPNDSYMTSDKPHSLGYDGPPRETTYSEIDGVKYNQTKEVNGKIVPADKTTFVDPTGTPDQLKRLNPGDFKIDKRGNKWTLGDGDPTDPNSWTKE